MPTGSSPRADHPRRYLVQPCHCWRFITVFLPDQANRPVRTSSLRQPRAVRRLSVAAMPARCEGGADAEPRRLLYRFEGPAWP